MSTKALFKQLNIEAYYRIIKLTFIEHHMDRKNTESKKHYGKSSSLQFKRTLVCRLALQIFSSAVSISSKTLNSIWWCDSKSQVEQSSGVGADVGLDWILLDSSFTSSFIADEDK